MSSEMSNTPKLGLKYLIDSNHYETIDCQLATEHLQALGAVDISREAFESALNRWA